MKLKYLVEQILQEKTLTPTVENEINDLLWSQDFDQSDMEALGQLLNVLMDGTVTTVNRDPRQLLTGVSTN